MNFLAHQHLSFPDKHEMIGNFIGDYVKGKKYLDYPLAVAKGIMLHRKIDAFTDKHPKTHACKQLFVTSYGRYAGVVVDMAYDYALAYNWLKYSEVSLDHFSQAVYQNLYLHFDLLPQRVQQFLPKMQKAQRLESYARIEGISYAIDLMSQYTSLPDKGLEFKQIVSHHQDDIFTCFADFYSDVQAYISDERKVLKISQDEF